VGAAWARKEPSRGTVPARRVARCDDQSGTTEVEVLTGFCMPVKFKRL